MIGDVMRGRIDELKWDDLRVVGDRCAELLPWLANPARLGACLAGLRESVIFGLSEQKRFQEKIVLYQSPVNGSSLRLHVFLPGHHERTQYIHDHRWSFGAHIVDGGYAHRIYDPPDHEAGPFRMAMLREERAGTVYTLDHATFHAVSALAYTTTLLLRGPVAKRAARFVREDGGGAAFEHVGAADEPSTGVEARRMTAERYEVTVERLRARGVVTMARGARC
jgi:hypothetical protein